MQVEIVDGHADLGMDEWAMAESGDILETGGASTCGIVAVLNHSQCRAWMVHQTAPHMILDDTTEMLDDAAASLQQTDNIEIWLAGCGSGSTKADDRIALMNAVSTYFPTKNPVIRWGSQELFLNFEDGTSQWLASST